MSDPKILVIGNGQYEMIDAISKAVVDSNTEVVQIGKALSPGLVVDDIPEERVFKIAASEMDYCDHGIHLTGKQKRTERRAKERKNKKSKNIKQCQNQLRKKRKR